VRSGGLLVEGNGAEVAAASSRPPATECAIPPVAVRTYQKVSLSSIIYLNIPKYTCNSSRTEFPGEVDAGTVSDRSGWSVIDAAVKSLRD
jgi:hypothetical protein